MPHKGRQSLNEKLKKRSDYDTIIKRVRTLPNPTSYIVETFQVTQPTAKRFLEEINVGQYIKEEEVDNIDSLDIAKKFVISLDFRFADCSANTLIKVREDLEKFSTSLLLSIFKELSGKDSITKEKWMIIRAISYLVQEKYYINVFKMDIPAKIKEITMRSVKECTV